MPVFEACGRWPTIILSRHLKKLSQDRMSTYQLACPDYLGFCYDCDCSQSVFFVELVFNQTLIAILNLFARLFKYIAFLKPFLLF